MSRLEKTFAHATLVTCWWICAWFSLSGYVRCGLWKGISPEGKYGFLRLWLSFFQMWMEPLKMVCRSFCSLFVLSVKKCLEINREAFGNVQCRHVSKQGYNLAKGEVQTEVLWLRSSWPFTTNFGLVGMTDDEMMMVANMPTSFFQLTPKRRH